MSKKISFKTPFWEGMEEKITEDIVGEIEKGVDIEIAKESIENYERGLIGRRQLAIELAFALGIIKQK